MTADEADLIAFSPDWGNLPILLGTMGDDGFIDLAGAAQQRDALVAEANRVVDLVQQGEFQQAATGLEELSSAATTQLTMEQAERVNALISSARGDLED